MAVSTIECPECQKVLKTSMAPGKKIRCPKCQAVFPVPEDDEEKRPVSAIRPKGAKTPARNRLDDDDDEDDEKERPRSRRNGAAGVGPRKRNRIEDDEDDYDRDDEDDRPRRKKKAKGGGMVLGLVIGGSAFFLLGGFALTAFVWPGFLLSKENKGPIGGGPVANNPLNKGPIPGNFKEFKSPAGRFKVLMPGNPKSQVQPVPGGGVLNAFLVEEINGAYMAAYADTPVPPGENEVQIQQRLDGARDGAIRNLKGALVRDNKIKWEGKHPGREIEANLPNNKGVVRARFYFVGSRMYQVMVLGTREWVNTPDAATFLDSFALTN